MKSDYTVIIETITTLDIEMGIANYVDKTVSVPRLGITVNLDNNRTGTKYSYPIGRVYAPELERDGWKMISKVKTVQFYGKHKWRK